MSGIEPRVSSMLSKHSVNRAMSPVYPLNEQICQIKTENRESLKAIVIIVCSEVSKAWFMKS